jgi:hypothetical protein
VSRIKAALHIVKDWLRRRVRGRRRSLRGTEQKLKRKEIRIVRGWKDQHLVIEDIMKEEVPGYE